MLNRSQDSAPACQAHAVDPDRVTRARAALVAPALIDDVTELFKVLSHPTRAHILRALSSGELCVCELAQVVGLSESSVSHQLRDLRRLKLVQHRMDGRLAWYSVRAPFVLDLLDQAVRHLSAGG